MRRLAMFAAVMLALLSGSAARAQSSTPRIDRLERLANYLETKVQPKRFDMGRWGNLDNPDDPNYEGCAAGYSTAIFRHDGLRLDHGDITYRGKASHAALVDFYGITDVESMRLFGARSLTPAEEAANIRRLTGEYRVKFASQTTAAILVCGTFAR